MKKYNKPEIEVCTKMENVRLDSGDNAEFVCFSKNHKYNPGWCRNQGCPYANTDSKVCDFWVKNNGH